MVSYPDTYNDPVVNMFKRRVDPATPSACLLFSVVLFRLLTVI